MSKFTLQQEGRSSHISVPNIFIEKYMPKAAGEFVKIYIYLLKCLEDNRQELSISKIADAFDDTQKDVIRALKYWQKRGLLKLTFEGEILTSLTMTDLAELPDEIDGMTQEPVTRNISGLKDRDGNPILTAGPAAGEPTTAADPDAAGNAGTAGPSVSGALPAAERTASPIYEKKTYSRDDIAAFSQTEDIPELTFAVQTYLGKPLSSADMNTLLFIYDTLGMSPDLIDYLFDYCVSMNHKSMRYIEKTAIGWTESGITTVKAAKTLRAIYSSNVYPVMNAFGLSGRKPTKSESDYISRWSVSYGFSLGVILEAVDRTMSTIHQPSFEYTDSILKKWKARNVQTLEDLPALDAEHDRKAAEKARAAADPSGASAKSASGKNASANKFHNFDQRSYNYDDLEEKLFNNF